MNTNMFILLLMYQANNDENKTNQTLFDRKIN